MDKDFEAFMDKKNQMDKVLDDELNNMMKGDPEFKKLKKKGSDSIDCKYKINKLL